MSDRDAIIASLANAVARIRTNRLIARVAFGLSIFIGIAVLAQALNLIVTSPPMLTRSFWILWLGGLAVFVFRNLRVAPSLSEAAANLDSQAGLKDEVVSAYWFLSQNISNPWVDLQVRRAASTIKDINLSNLYPLFIPKTSYFAAAGLVLLLALNWVPFAPGETGLTSSEPPDTTDLVDTEELFSEIEELLDRAERLQASQAIEEFQELIQQMRDSQTPLDEAEREMQAIEGMIDEGNLDMANLLEGLEEMGQDLSQSDDTLAAGRELMGGEPGAAAEEFERLAEQLAEGAEPTTDLGDALAEAAENRRPGLEELADQLEAAADSLGQEDLNGVTEALRESAQSLTQIANAIESQRLQNEAAARLDALEEALRQQEVQPLSEFDLQEGSSAPGEPLDMTAGPEGIPQPGEQEQAGLEETTGLDLPSGGEGEPGEMGEGGQQPGQNIENVSGDDSGMIPLGYGFSPEVKEGLPTSLDVLLQAEAVEAQLDELAPDDASDAEELASQREASELDYRNVPSDLTPAQQELLNQDTIPREYQNVIREYFEAIRPTRQ